MSKQEIINDIKNKNINIDKIINQNTNRKIHSQKKLNADPFMKHLLLSQLLLEDSKIIGNSKEYYEINRYFSSVTELHFFSLVNHFVENINGTYSITVGSMMTIIYLFLDNFRNGSIEMSPRLIVYKRDYDENKKPLKNPILYQLQPSLNLLDKSFSNVIKMFFEVNQRMHKYFSFEYQKKLKHLTHPKRFLESIYINISISEFMSPPISLMDFIHISCSFPVESLYNKKIGEFPDNYIDGKCEVTNILIAKTIYENF